MKFLLKANRAKKAKKVNKAKTKVRKVHIKDQNIEYLILN